MIAQDQVLPPGSGIAYRDQALGFASAGPVCDVRAGGLARVAKGGAEMVESPIPTGVPLVPCEVCMKEIPKSAALSAEDRDYVLYFCGLDCYEEWSGEQIRERTREAGEP